MDSSPAISTRCPYPRRRLGIWRMRHWTRSYRRLRIVARPDVLEPRLVCDLINPASSQGVLVVTDSKGNSTEGEGIGGHIHLIPGGSVLVLSRYTGAAQLVASRPKARDTLSGCMFRISIPCSLQASKRREKEKAAKCSIRSL